MALAIVGAVGHGLDLYAIAQHSGIDAVLCDTRVPDSMPERCEHVLGISRPQQRHRFAQNFDWPPGLLVDLSARLGPATELNGGVVVGPGVVLLTDCHLDEHVHLHYGVQATRTEFGAYTTVAPGAVICGDVRIGSCVYVGAGAVIKERVSIGADATVGAGAVVVEDVPAGAVVKGNPAR